MIIDTKLEREGEGGREEIPPPRDDSEDRGSSGSRDDSEIVLFSPITLPLSDYAKCCLSSLT